MTGIYKITNLINGKVYIGQAVDIEYRWKNHITKLNCNRHHNKHLQNSWNKYGQENFKFEIAEECEEEKLTEREQYWIDYYGGFNGKNTYNQKEAGEKGRLSDEVKQRISNSKIGIKTGPLSEEHKRKISEGNKGKKHTEEYKRKASERLKGKNNPNYGKHLSEETKQKISKANKGKFKGPMSEETKLKIRQSKLGHSYSGGWHHTEEAKQKMREARLGKKRENYTISEETRQKLREANLGSNNPRYGVKITEETRQKLKTSIGDRVWVNNGINEKWIRKEKLEEFLTNDYVIGRTFKKLGRKNKNSSINIHLQGSDRRGLNE